MTQLLQIGIYQSFFVLFCGSVDVPQRVADLNFGTPPNSRVAEENLDTEKKVGSPPFEADIFYDGEGPSGPITLAMMTNQTHAVQFYGPWTHSKTLSNSKQTSPDPDGDIEFSTDAQMAKLRRPISVKGKLYDGSGSTGFAVNISTNSINELRYRIPPSQIVLVGFFFKTAVEDDFEEIDVVEIRSGTGGTWCSLQWRANAPTPWFNAHSEKGISTQGGPSNDGRIFAAKDVVYWCQLRYESGANAEIAIWRMSDWQFLGTVSIGMGIGQAQLIIAPEAGAHGELSPSSPYTYTDNYVIRMTAPVPPVTELTP
jgi:hypothetical protein